MPHDYLYALQTVTRCLVSQQTGWLGQGREEGRRKAVERPGESRAGQVRRATEETPRVGAKS